MILFIDIENKKLVQGLNTDRISSSPNFMQGDCEPIEIHLLARGTSTLYEDKILNPNMDFLRVGIARFKADPKLLSITSEYEPLETGGCIVMLPLNTLQIETALGNNPSLDAYLEIEYSTSGGRVVTVLQTSCKVKNDLIEDAPNIDLEEQFLNKSQIEGMFLAKSDNLAGVEDKEQARENLDVFSKNDTDSNFLSKLGNLAGISDKDEARKNLNAVSMDIYKDINTLGSFSGIYSRSSLYYYDNNSSSAGIGGDYYNEISTFTVLTTFLSPTGMGTIFRANSSSDYKISIDTNGQRVYCGYYYGSDYNYYDYAFYLTKKIEFGDKVAVTYKNSILYVYKNAELVGEYEVPTELKFCNPNEILEYVGIKKDFVFSTNFALPLTKAEGIAAGYGYSIEEWTNNVPLPSNLLWGLMKFEKRNFSTPMGSGNWLQRAAPKTFAGVSNTMVVYKEKNTYGREFQLFQGSGNGYVSYGGVYLFKMRVHIPASNTEGKKLYVRPGSYTFNSATQVEVISRKNIDEKGYVTELDKWVDVEIKFRWKATSGFGNMTMHLVNEANSFSFMGTNDDTNERFYVASASIQGLEGFDAYYEGGLENGWWKDLTGNGYDFKFSSLVGMVSYPTDPQRSFAKTVTIESFSWSNYWYDIFPTGYEITQIVFTPNQAVPDTSGEDEYSRNVFEVYDSGSYYVAKEHLPAIPAKAPYIIKPQYGLNKSYSSLSLNSMYRLSFGGTVTFYLQKCDL